MQRIALMTTIFLLVVICLVILVPSQAFEGSEHMWLGDEGYEAAVDRVQNNGTADPATLQTLRDTHVLSSVVDLSVKNNIKVGESGLCKLKVHSLSLTHSVLGVYRYVF